MCTLFFIFIFFNYVACLGLDHSLVYFIPITNAVCMLKEHFLPFSSSPHLHLLEQSRTCIVCRPFPPSCSNLWQSSCLFPPTQRWGGEEQPGFWAFFQKQSWGDGAASSCPSSSRSPTKWWTRIFLVAKNHRMPVGALWGARLMETSQMEESLR